VFCERNDLSVEEVGETFHDSKSGVTVHQHCLVSDWHDLSWVCNLVISARICHINRSCHINKS